MRRKVYFHGQFKDLAPEGIEVEARTIADAIEGVTRQFPQLRPKPGQNKQVFRVLGMKTVDMLRDPKVDMTTIRLVPFFSGGGGGGKGFGFIKIAIGIAIIAAAPYLGGAGGLLGGTIFEASIGTIAMGGAFMALGGLLEVMSPAPSRDTSDAYSSNDGISDPVASKYLGAPKNTVAIGTRIPIGYGRHRVYGHYISFDIQAKDMADAPNGSETPEDRVNELRQIGVQIFGNGSAFNYFAVTG